MNVSPLAGQTDLTTIDVLIDGKALASNIDLISVETRREVNRIGWARIAVSDGDPSDETFALSESATFVPGAKVEIRLGYHQNTQTVFKGLIVKHGLRVSERGVAQLVLECAESAVKLTLTRQSAVYLNKTDQAVMQQLISDAGLAATVDSTSVSYEELVRYHCCDWDFVLTRAEINGLIAVVDDDKLTIAKPAVSSACGLVVRYGEALRELHTDIDARPQLSQVSANAWDISTQDALSANSSAPTLNQQGNLSGETLAKALNPGAGRLQSDAPLEQGDLKQWADASLLRMRLARIRGTVAFQGNALPQPNTTLELAGLGARFNGDAYIASVSHQAGDGNWVTEVGFGLPARNFAETTPDIAPPPAAGQLPATGGLHIGKVMKIDSDPQNQTRVQIKLPLFDADGHGVWARMGSPYASNQFGVQFMPEIDDEVVVGFVNNDPRFPVILGSLYSSKRPPPTTPDNKNTLKSIVTRSTLKLTFNDEKKILTASTPGGHQLVMSDDDKSILIEDSHGNQIKLSGDGILISSPKDIKITATGNLETSSTGKTTLTATQDLKASGLNVEASAQIGAKLSGSATAELSASGQTTVKGALVMIN